MKRLFLFFAFIAALLSASRISAQTELDPDIFAKTTTGQLKAWIFFKDKGKSPAALMKPEQILSERAIKRRMLRRPQKALIEFSDLPVYEPYIEAVKPRISRIRVVSRWLNGISAEVSLKNLEAIRNFDFVLKIDPVIVGKRILPRPDEEKTPPLPKRGSTTDSLPYGESLDQLELINVPFLHQQGFYGEDVVICMLDDGFNLLYHHLAFDSLNVLATYDFIHGDEGVDDSQFKAYEGWHGTKTLSVIAGYAPGMLIGAAFKASFLLAKTEVDQSETPIEEDYWVAGIEWGEKMGADIVSSSLGYVDWYTPAQMDGKTAKTTIAAEMAVDKGVIVFNSAGNEGDDPYTNTLLAPADGEKVLAVAAVDRFGLRASFSSVGPTADGRIKPDIAAMGVYVVTADQKDSTGFNYASGTSFSCPLASGGAALLLQAFPQTTPELMAKALKETASQADFPDKYLGWGIIDLKKAYNYLDTATVREDKTKLNHLQIFSNEPNPADEKTRFSFRVENPSDVEIRIYDITGRKVKSLGTKRYKAHRKYYEEFRTKTLASGTYIYHVLARELGTGIIYRKSGKFVVLH